MSIHTNQATETQAVNLAPLTANALARVLNSWAQSVGAPEIFCDAGNVAEIDIQRIITLASLAVGSPDVSARGLS